MSFAQSARGPYHKQDTVVIPFEFKQSAIYQPITNKMMDSVSEILLLNDSITLSIDGYSHFDEGNDTITKYLSLNRALFVKTYILGRGIDTSRFASITSYGRTRQLYRGTINMGIGNCRAVIKLNYPPPRKPLSDRDGDGLLDSLDSCPDEYGAKENQGCPDSAIIVPFDEEQSSLHALTYRVLDSVIVILKNNPLYTLNITGHAYPTEGTRTVYERIALERATMVKEYLRSRFIDVKRIDTFKSLGSNKPITAGRNPKEIVRNCRVEIFLNKHQ
ncbi:MAG: OmpA family protein [Ferruginibacter sp.]